VRYRNGYAFNEMVAPQKVVLYAPDESNCFVAELKHNSNGSDWQQETITLGASNEYDAATDTTKYGKWQTVGSPSWLQVSTLVFLC
jgi:hypothetical protein